ncbi:phytoene desaturase family protein [Paenibacillus sp. YPG26]|uniref:phytoene desaturase family protein n=1 Tax=Paenibacillus sp. YPG26 TaxID=2878915 RepID=UPI00203C3CD9|nr:phytoene desaturase family protein [Paenibacillus sp. YPG26]USB32907.1 phytoene desaturase [Paenibacillus sp. YPG26]
MKPMKRVAIVGGGIGGLTAALMLNRHGVDVTLYEQKNKVGGRLAFEQEGAYRIDQGPTIVLLPEMLLSLLEEAGVSRSRITLLPCEPMYDIHYANGRKLTKYRERDAMAEELAKVFPGEEGGFIRFMERMEKLYPAGQESFLERSFPRRRDFFTPDNLRLMWRLRAYQSLRTAAAGYFSTSEVRDAFSLQSLYIGGAPHQTPGIYTMLPYAEHAFGVWMLKGGYASLPLVLEEELRRRGGTIETGRRIDQLVVENGVCRGVVAEGERQAYDAVLYNGEFTGMEELLVEGMEGKPASRKRTFKPSSGCVLVYLGVRRRWSERRTHQFFLPESFMDHMHEVFEHGRIPGQPSYYVFNPAALDEEAAPPGESVLYMLIPVPPGLHGLSWADAAEPLVERVLEDAERRGFPGLRGAIAWRRIRTPEDAAADGLYGGGSFGIAPVLRQSGVYRPQPRPYNIRGLYAAGASIHPGGGVPIVMQGAGMASEQMLKEMGIEWISK